MVNFGERIAYWYLRLNGFFLVENFVLHGKHGEYRTSDADLLGIRLRHSSESIDGVPLCVHAHLQQHLGDFANNVALIVQVKTSLRDRTADAAFEGARIRTSLAFMGMIPNGEIEQVGQALSNAPFIIQGDWLIAKLLIATAPNGPGAVTLRLEDVLAFIKDRLSAHSRRKAADRMFFPDELMQFLAWESCVRGARG